MAAPQRRTDIGPPIKRFSSAVIQKITELGAHEILTAYMSTWPIADKIWTVRVASPRLLA